MGPGHAKASVDPGSGWSEKKEEKEWGKKGSRLLHRDDDRSTKEGEGVERKGKWKRE